MPTLDDAGWYYYTLGVTYLTSKYLWEHGDTTVILLFYYICYIWHIWSVSQERVFSYYTLRMTYLTSLYLWDNDTDATMVLFYHIWHIWHIWLVGDKRSYCLILLYLTYLTYLTSWGEWVYLPIDTLEDYIWPIIVLWS